MKINSNKEAQHNVQKQYKEHESGCRKMEQQFSTM